MSLIVPFINALTEETTNFEWTADNDQGGGLYPGMGFIISDNIEALHGVKINNTVTGEFVDIYNASDLGTNNYIHRATIVGLHANFSPAVSNLSAGQLYYIVVSAPSGTVHQAYSLVWTSGFRPVQMQNISGTGQFNITNSGRLEGFGTSWVDRTSSDESYNFDEFIFNSTVATSSIDLLFSNSSNPLNYKDSFGEGEHFIGYINWTNDADGLGITDSVGSCNMTMFGVTKEQQGDFDNFTLCESGCNFSERQKEFDFQKTTDAVLDSVHFDGCHEQTASGDLDVTFSCGGASEVRSIPSSEMPLCNGGNTDFVRVTSDVCIGSRFVNISVNTTGTIPFSQRKRILNSAADREFTKELMIDGVDFFFNDSTGLWFTDHVHEIYLHGSYTMQGNCTYTTDSDLDNSVEELITIVNVPPKIDINEVNTSLGITVLLNNVFIEYAGGVWNWFISVSDDDLSFVNVTWYNLTGGIMKSVGGSNVSMLDLNTVDQFFSDFSFMPFNLTVFANDTDNANTTVSILFNVTDVSAPVLTGVVNDTVANLTNFSFSHTITDELVWTYNVSCTDGFSFEQTSINSNSFNYNFSRLINNTLSCTIVACDGHTGKLTERIIGERLTPNSFSLGVHEINVSTSIISVATIHFFDRTRFTIKTTNPVKSVSFTLGKDWVRAYSRYDGHYVNSKTKEWIDFESNDYIVTTKDNTITVNSDVFIDTFSFNSIGELNCVTAAQTITGTSDASAGAITVNICPNDSTANVLLIWLYMAIALGLFLIGIVFRIYILGFFGGAIVTYSYYILVACNDFMSGLIGFAGIIMILVSLFRWLIDSFSGKSSH